MIVFIVRRRRVLLKSLINLSLTGQPNNNKSAA